MERHRTEQNHVMEMVSEKRASSWLTALALKRYGFRLTKSYGLCIRYLETGFALDITLLPKTLPLPLIVNVVKSLTYHMTFTVGKGLCTHETQRDPRHLC